MNYDAPLLKIKTPIWKKPISVGIASFRVRAVNYVEIEYEKKDGERMFPGKFRVSGEVVRSCPTKTVNQGKIKLYVVPIELLEPVD